jgi:cell wall-associated NlpC family hydrolase
VVITAGVQRFNSVIGGCDMPIRSLASLSQITPNSAVEANNIPVESQSAADSELLPPKTNTQFINTGIANNSDRFETIQQNHFPELNPTSIEPPLETKKDAALMESFHNAMFRSNLRAAFSSPPIMTEPESKAGQQASEAMEEAMKFLGTASKWGGSTPETGFDASGLMQWAYRKAGIEIPRTAQQQFDSPNGIKVDRNNLRPGDLVAFRDQSGSIDHVGMYLGNGKFLHASNSGDVVKISDLNEPYYANRFSGGVRFDQTNT